MVKLCNREAESKEKQKRNFNQQQNFVPLKVLQPGIPVHIKNTGNTGKVTRAAETPRSYMMLTEKGTEAKPSS